MTRAARQQGLDPNQLTVRGVELANQQCPEDARWSNVLQGKGVGNGRSSTSARQNLFFTLVLVVAYVAVLLAEFREGGPVMSL